MRYKTEECTGEINYLNIIDICIIYILKPLNIGAYLINSCFMENKTLPLYKDQTV